MNILHLEICSDDLAATEAFYGSTMGLLVVSKNQAAISFGVGTSVLTFKQSNKQNPTYHFAFNIPHNQIEEAASWVASKLELIKNPDRQIINHFESWHAKAIHCYDNNQNILEFIARFDLPNAVNAPFSTASILSISEIGIVTDEPMGLANTFIQTSGLDYFTKGIKSEDFVPMGNDDGLFILVQTGRKWFPTTQQAGKHPVTIQAVNNGLVQGFTFP